MTEPGKIEYSICFKMGQSVFDALVVESTEACMPWSCGMNIVDRLRMDGSSVKIAKGIWMTDGYKNRRVWVWVEGLWLRGIVDMCCDQCYEKMNHEIDILKRDGRDDIVVWIE